MPRFAKPFAFALFASALFAPAGRAADPDPLLPAETDQIYYVNVRQMLDSDIFKKNALPKFKEQLDKKGAKDFLEEIGFDPLKDLETITLGLYGEKLRELTTLAILRGTFDANKLFDAAVKYSKEKPDKLAIFEEGDYKLVRFVGDDGKPGFAAVADAKTLLVSSESKVVAKALDAAGGKPKPVLGKELTQLLKPLDEKASFFYAGLLEGRFKNLPDAKLPVLPIGEWPIDGGKLTDGLKNLTAVAATVRVGRELALEATLTMKDADSADDFGATLTTTTEFLKKLLPLAVLQDPTLEMLTKEFNNTMKVKSKDRNVVVGLKLSIEAISKAAKTPDDE